MKLNVDVERNSSIDEAHGDIYCMPFLQKKKPHTSSTRCRSVPNLNLRMRHMDFICMQRL